MTKTLSLFHNINMINVFFCLKLYFNVTRQKLIKTLKDYEVLKCQYV